MRLNNIKRIRHESGIYKAKELAQMVGVTQSTIVAWEKNRSQPMSNNLIKLLNAINSRRAENGMNPIEIDEIFNNKNNG